MSTELWTLAELADRVAGALSSGYGGQQSRRVTEVPDTRSIRYYTTLGLVDRPAAMRGRTALYGERHLWQLVAIKRLQADGRSLAEVQLELAGAPDATLRRLAAIPAESFWRRIPARSAPARSSPAQVPAEADGQAPMPVPSMTPTSTAPTTRGPSMPDPKKTLRSATPPARPAATASRSTRPCRSTAARSCWSPAATPSPIPR